MCTRQEMTGRYCSPHGERKNELAGEEGVVVAENDIGRRSGEEQERGSARRQRTGTWSKRSSMSNGRITREGKESERERVIVRVLHRWRLYQRRQNRGGGTGEIGARAWGKNVCECKREVTRVLPDLSTSREGKRGSGRGGGGRRPCHSWPAGFAGDGRRETEGELGKGVGAMIECLLLGVKDGRERRRRAGAAGIPAAHRFKQRKGRGRKIEGGANRLGRRVSDCEKKKREEG
jgi:hypothetical protein